MIESFRDNSVLFNILTGTRISNFEESNFIILAKAAAKQNGNQTIMLLTTQTKCKL